MRKFYKSLFVNRVCLFFRDTAGRVHAFVWKNAVTHRWPPSYAFVRQHASEQSDSQRYESPSQLLLYLISDQFHATLQRLSVASYALV
jgi:hypothetical protein